MKRDFLSLKNISREDILKILNLAHKFKEKNYKDNFLDKKSVVLLFTKPSTRTRLSFEIGIHQLGGFPVFLNQNQTQLTRGESLEHTAKVISRYANVLVIRTYSQSEIEMTAKNIQIPVINALTDLYHPCQVIADLMTLEEHFNSLHDIKITYLGDGNNVANSLINACAIMNINLTISTPNDYQCDPSVLQFAKQYNNISFTSDPLSACKGSDVLYTDVWVSMGDKDSNKHKHSLFPYQINEQKFALAKEGALFMHCLPVHEGQEVEKQVLKSKRSIIFDQAENRLYAQKSILAWTLNQTI